MTEAEQKYLKLARAARDENNSEDAKRYYDMVRTENPENGEAKVFYQIYTFWESKKGESESRFEAVTKVLAPSVKLISQSEDTIDAKLDIISAIIKEFAPMTRVANKNYMDCQTGSTHFASGKILTSGAIGLYNLGDAVASEFPGNSKAMELATIAWKEGIEIQNKYYAKQYNYQGRTVDQYVAKIQTVDSSYVAPKKPGCISVG